MKMVIDDVDDHHHHLCLVIPFGQFDIILFDSISTVSAIVVIIS